MKFKEELKVGSNVRLRLLNRRGGDVVEERESHNIFVNYGREWISELIAYQSGYTAFRGDRINYVAVGIGGYQQTLSTATIRSLGYAGYADDWDYGDYGGGYPSDPSELVYGGEGGTGTADPSQTDSDPAVTGLEYPVQITSLNYYDEIAKPATFPEAGTVRFTAVLGYTDVSYGAYASVPLSEIGLFTASATEGVTNTAHPPLDATLQLGDFPPASGNYYPPAGTRYMVAYNTFPPLSKTSAFVLQVDWELRFS